ncbi:MAG TPA: hypothetical protein VEL69_03345, partial [Ktedonobacteraceae bacterium]|nr:hypothetical protein [Ktedonobacteraceae bacterium]
TYPDLDKYGRNGGTAEGPVASDAYLDEENDGEFVISSASGMSMSMAPPQNDAVSLSPKNKAHYEEYKTKYGEPSGGGNRAARNGWEPMQASPSQLKWMQRGLTIFSSLMLSSLFYSVLSQMPFLAHQPPLSPNPWFSVVLMGIVPAATLGTLVVNWSRAWGTRDTLNRICTGLSIALLAVSFSELVWQLLLHANAPVLQLFVMLLAAALGSAAGVNQQVSDRMIDGVYWSLGLARWLIIAAGVVIGGILGAMLAIGFALSPFTFFGILCGSAIGLALVTRIDQLH